MLWVLQSKIHQNPNVFNEPYEKFSYEHADISEENLLVVLKNGTCTNHNMLIKF